MLEILKHIESISSNEKKTQFASVINILKNIASLEINSKEKDYLRYSLESQYGCESYSAKKRTFKILELIAMVKSDSPISGIAHIKRTIDLLDLEDGDKWTLREQLAAQYGCSFKTLTNHIQKFEDDYNSQTDIGKWKPIIPLDEYILPKIDVYDILPNQWADFVSNITEVVQVDLMMVLSSFFAVFATTLQRKVEIDLITHREQLSLYFALIAHRGERKSAIDNIMTQPLLEYAKNFNEEKKDDLAKIRAFRNQAEKRKEYLYREIAKLKDKSESKKDLEKYQKETEELEQFLIENPEPHELLLVSDNATVEKLAVRMQQNDERMSIFSSEAGIFMDIINPNKKVNIDIYLKGYSGDNSDNDRITRGYVHLRKPALTIALMVQPDVIEIFGQNPYLEGRGLLDRFVYIKCKPMVGNRLRQKKTIDEKLEEMYRKSIFELLENLEYKDTENKLPHLMELTKEAEAYWDDYYNAVESALNNELLDIMNYGSKVAGRAARLAGVIHFMKHGVNGVNSLIDLDTMERACNINTIFLEHARATFRTVNEPGLEVAQRILSIITANNMKEFSHRDIAHKSSLKKKESQQPGIELLIDHNYIKGTSTTRFIVNPELLKTSNNGNKAG